MHRTRPTLLWLFCLIPIICSSCSTLPSSSQTIQLFNGQNLDGLYTWLVDTEREDPRGVFTVTNGMIRISGEGLGYIGTLESYRDYRLVVEFRWGDTNWHWGDRVGKARDSGIFLHSVGPDGNSHDGEGAFRAAIECNVFEGATGDFLLIRGSDENGELIAPRVTIDWGGELDADGWPYAVDEGQSRTIERWGRVNWMGKSREWTDRYGFRGENDAESLAGEWTRVECFSVGGVIRIRVNGRWVNRAYDVFPAEGRILLQCEGSELFVRRFEIETLR